MTTRAERRHKDWSKAIRKRNIARNIYPKIDDSTWEYYDNLHQYSKNKIHCSCGMCSAKTKNKGHRRHIGKNYSPSYNPSIKDMRSNDKMNYREY